MVVLIAVTPNDYYRAAERICRAELWSIETGVPSLMDRFVEYNDTTDKWQKVMDAFVAENIVQRIIGGELSGGDGPDRGVDLVRDEITYQIKYNSYPFGGFYPKTGTHFVAERGILVVSAGEYRMKIAGWCDQTSYGIHREPKKLTPTNTVMIVEAKHLYDIHSLLR